MYFKSKLFLKLVLAFLAVGVIPFAVMAAVVAFQAEESLTREVYSRLTGLRATKSAALERYFNLLDRHIKAFASDPDTLKIMQDFKKYYRKANGENATLASEMRKMKAGLDEFYRDQFGARYRELNRQSGPPPLEALQDNTSRGDNELVFLRHLYIADNPHPLSEKSKLIMPKDESTYSYYHGQHHVNLKSFLENYGFGDIYLIEPEHGDIVYSVAKRLDFATSLQSGPFAQSGLAACYQKIISAVKNGAKDPVVLADYKPYLPNYNAPASFIGAPVFDKQNRLAGVAVFQLPMNTINAIMTENAGLASSGQTYLVGGDLHGRSGIRLPRQNHGSADGVIDTEPVRRALAGKTGEMAATSYHGGRVLSAFAPLKAGDSTWALVAEVNEKEALAGVDHLLALIGLAGAACLVAIVIGAFMLGVSITRPIKRTLSGLSAGARNMALVASQVAGNSQSLSTGASQQAASLQETTSNLEELSGLARDNAASAGLARDATKDAGYTIQGASQAINDIAGSMQEINQASKKTSNIIKDINEIAFQTNLLALNAAVEAARAGEAGAGFAVVADEVRSLALRTSEAAGNTAQLIKDTLGKVQRGVDLAQNAAQSFHQVLEKTQATGEMVEVITVSSQKQTHGVEQISKATNEIGAITQQVAASAEQSAAASQEFSSQAAAMEEMVRTLASMVGNPKDSLSDENNGAKAAPPRQKRLLNQTMRALHLL